MLVVALVLMTTVVVTARGVVGVRLVIVVHVHEIKGRGLRATLHEGASASEMILQFSLDMVVADPAGILAGPKSPPGGTTGPTLPVRRAAGVVFSTRALQSGRARESMSGDPLSAF